MSSTPIGNHPLVRKIKSVLGTSDARGRAATTSRNFFEQDKWRYRTAWLVVAVVFSLLALGAFYRQVAQHEMLQKKADNMILRTATIEAHRGMLLDRNGIPLAISTPMLTLWFDPYEFLVEQQKQSAIRQKLALEPQSRRLKRQLSKNDFDLDQLALATNVPRSKLEQYLKQAQARMTLNEELVKAGKKPIGQFRYAVLQRQLQPDTAAVVLDRRFQSVYAKQEYQRYYTQPQPNAQLLGITNVENRGIEGLERWAQDRLAGENGKIRVMNDKQGNRIKEVGMTKPERPGEDIRLSVDSRLQYIMYRELAAGGIANSARSATAVLIEPETGEVLAMTSWPSFNPNDSMHGLSNKDSMRNRAMVDSFEPGSTMKPLTISAALETGHYHPNSLVNTNPGSLRVGSHTIHDHGNLGMASLQTIIVKSSNVGVAKIALSLPSHTLPSFYQRVGLAHKTAINFPGETKGFMLPPSKWNQAEVATMSYGYGLNVTAIQLAQAYTVLANEGCFHPVTLLYQEKPTPGKQLISARITRAVLNMMEGVTQPGGTAPQAAIPGYRVAGKTGTAHKVRPDGRGYSQTDYRALFVGLAPASKPRFVLAVVVENPVGKYYGGLVAAPIFQRIMSEALRLYGVPMDAPLEQGAHAGQPLATLLTRPVPDTRATLPQEGPELPPDVIPADSGARLSEVAAANQAIDP